VQSIGHKLAQRWCNGRGVHAGLAAVAHSELVPRGPFARRRRNRRGERLRTRSCPRHTRHHRDAPAARHLLSGWIDWVGHGSIAHRCQERRRYDDRLQEGGAQEEGGAHGVPGAISDGYGSELHKPYHWGEGSVAGSAYVKNTHCQSWHSPIHGEPLVTQGNPTACIAKRSRYTVYDASTYCSPSTVQHASLAVCSTQSVLERRREHARRWDRGYDGGSNAVPAGYSQDATAGTNYT
jgi:hypothetical protein